MVLLPPSACLHSSVYLENEQEGNLQKPTQGWNPVGDSWPCRISETAFISAMACLLKLPFLFV